MFRSEIIYQCKNNFLKINNEGILTKSNVLIRLISSVLKTKTEILGKI